MSRSRTRRSPRLDELRLAMPEERFEAGLVFGRHADRVGELRRWCTSATDKTPVARRSPSLRAKSERLRRRRARSPRGRAASVSRRRRLAPALVAKCRGGRQGDDPYLQEVRTPRLIRRGSEWRRRDPTTPAAGSSAARAQDRGPGPRRARDRWGATVDRSDGVLDNSEAATGDVRMRPSPASRRGARGYGNSTTNTRLLPNGSPLDPTHSVLPFSTDDLATS
jgi:hypothetical protein